MSAESTFVLVPGAGGASWYWHRVVAELERRDHAAIAVELPADDPAAGIDEYVDIIVAAAAGMPKVTIVGQSMGAFSAVPSCDRLPVEGLVLVNAMIPDPGETAGAWWGNTGAPAAKAALDVAQGRDPDAELDPLTYFFHDLPASMFEASAAYARNEVDRAFETPSPFTVWPDVPTKVITGRDDRFFPAEFQRRLAKERLGLDVTEVPGGHLAALSHPVEVTDALLASGLVNNR
jgi:pimeloyl-ACP methyl ester carboxylesterase